MFLYFVQLISTIKMVSICLSILYVIVFAVIAIISSIEKIDYELRRWDKIIFFIAFMLALFLPSTEVLVG